MAQEFTTIAQVTKTEISKWKQTKSGLKRIEIPLDDDDLTGDGEKASFIICKPTRNVLNAVTEYAKDKDVEKINDVLISNCVLGGDMKYLDAEVGDTQVYTTVLEELGKLMEKKRVISKAI